MGPKEPLPQVMQQEKNAESDQYHCARGYALGEVSRLPGARLRVTRTEGCCQPKRIWRGTARLNGSSCVYRIQYLVNHKEAHPNAKNDVPVVGQIRTQGHNQGDKNSQVNQAFGVLAVV